MGADSQTIFDLLQVHADLRRNGCSRMESWEFTRQKAVERIDKDGLKKLHSFVQEWERVEGYKYPSHAGGNVPEHLRKSDTIRPITPIASLNPNQANPITMRPFQNEPPGAGLVDENFSITELRDEVVKTTPGYFPPESRLLLYIQNHPTPLMYKPSEGQELIVGRYIPDSPVKPDIDLSRFCSEDHGVSRMHAAINRHGTTLVITDLGSRNYTIVNGLRLKPRQVRVLNHNDEVHFGAFPVRVQFYRAA